jgi:hypothetical protein
MNRIYMCKVRQNITKRRGWLHEMAINKKIFPFKWIRWSKKRKIPPKLEELSTMKHYFVEVKFHIRTYPP